MRSQRPKSSKRRPSRKGPGPKIRRGMQWPHESDAQALAAWSQAVASWNGTAEAGTVHPDLLRFLAIALGTLGALYLVTR